MFFIAALQEQEIQSLTAEIESLKNPQNLNASKRLEELREENARLKYRLNILKRVRAANVPGWDTRHTSTNQEQPSAHVAVCVCAFVCVCVCVQGALNDGLCCCQSMMNINQYLQEIFEVAIRTSFPDLENPPLALAPNQQAKFGDYQCNSAMAMAQVRAPPGGRRVLTRRVSVEMY